MKIRRLRFKNLNSLAGEWAIDFTAPEYECEGIFAITGPTGSGKTTILDAICLALYGQTPRLGKITNGGNEIMSRQTGECFAELQFGTARGEFVAHWSQRRSRDKAAGKLQAPRHEIADATTGKPLESMLSKVGKVVEDLCGMDFERFTRSSMLAQGNFAKFLESNANERAPILEQITGTRIYSELSILVHERKTAEDGKRQTLKDQLEGVTLLSDEDREKIEAEQKSVTETFKQVKKQLEILQKAENWLISCGKDARIVLETEKAMATHDEKISAFSEFTKTLAAAKNAREIAPQFDQLTRLRGEVKKTQAELGTLTTAIVTQEKLVQERLQRSESAQENLVKAKADRVAAEPKIESAQKLTHGLLEIEKRLEKEGADLKTLDRKIKEEATKMKALQNALELGEKGQAESQKFLKENAALEKLSSAYSGLAARLQSWRAESEASEKNGGILAKLKKRIADFVQVQNELGARFETAKKAWEVRQTELGILENGREELLAGHEPFEIEASLEKCERQLDLERKIVSLSDERAKLMEGEACPLCGSELHPFSEGESVAQAQIGATEKEILRLKKALKDLGLAEKAIGTCQLAVVKENAAVNLLKGEGKTLQAKIAEEKVRRDELAVDCGRAVQKLTHGRDEIAADLRSFGLNESELGTFENTDIILRQLAVKRDAWQSHSEKSKRWENEKTGLHQELKHQEKALAERNELAEKNRKEVGGIEAELKKFRVQLNEILGGQNLTDFRSEFRRKIDLAEKVFAEANAGREKAAQQLGSSRTRRADLEKRRGDLELERSDQEKVFSVALAESDFGDEAAFLAARLESEKFLKLSAEADGLEKRKSELAIQLAQTKTRLAELRELKLTEESLNDLRTSITEFSERYDEESKRLGAFQQQLKQDAETREKLAEKRELLAKQEMECARWSRLHKLIGSSDGKKFRNFAQGLTFELMVRHANRQLAKMNERYQLVRAAESPLDLEVIDSYQAGEIRSTKNLSGGESFIVSLALALGLSKMSSERVRVDSLFLDEGFGTLDEEALDTALGTLASLNSEGKLIGLISHVPALKERISTQLSLESGRNGTSILRGPGVS